MGIEGGQERNLAYWYSVFSFQYFLRIFQENNSTKSVKREAYEQTLHFTFYLITFPLIRLKLFVISLSRSRAGYHHDCPL